MSKKAEYELVVEDKKCKLSSISIEILEMALSYLSPINGNVKMIQAGEIILRNCWVEGDKEILEDEKYKAAACIQACGLIDIKQASLKKI